MADLEGSKSKAASYQDKRGQDGEGHLTGWSGHGIE